jgi:hypothetical protein
MKTVAEIRRQNLEDLIKELGSAAALAERIGTAPQYISQILHATPDTKTGRGRTLGTVLARRIEKQLSKEDGWMDQAHYAPTQPVGAVLAKEPSSEIGTLSVREIDAVLALRALSKKKRSDFIDLLMAAAEEYRQFATEVIARQGVTPVSGKPLAGGSLPVRPDGEQEDTVPGQLSELRR